MTWCTKLIMAIVGALGARPAAAILVGNIQLYVNDIDVLPESASASFTAPGWTGYVDQAVVLTGPFGEDAGHGYELIALTSWALGDVADDPVTVVGAIIKDAGGVILAGGKFPAPVNLENVTQSLNLLGTLRAGADGLGGEWVTIE